MPPLMPIVTGDAVAAIIQSFAPPPGTLVTTVQLQTMWEQIITAQDLDFQTNADVQPGTFANGGGPVLGLGGPLL